MTSLVRDETEYDNISNIASTRIASIVIPLEYALSIDWIWSRMTGQAAKVNCLDA